MITKFPLLAWTSVGTLVVYADLPLYFLFGLASSFIMLEAGHIKREFYPFFTRAMLNATVGWIFSFGVKHYKPEWFIGEIRVFSMFITTLISYTAVIYLFKNKAISVLFSELIPKIIEKYVFKYFKIKDDGDS